MTVAKGDAKGHFDNYAEYSKTLRSWLVAYGIGAPVLFLTGKDVPDKIAKSPQLQLIIVLFVGGVALQTVLAFVNKWAAWHMYKGDLDVFYRKKRAYKFWSWVNDQNWIDISIDLISIGSFSIATDIVLNTLLSKA
jgi:hypothetical protein